MFRFSLALLFALSFAAPVWAAEETTKPSTDWTGTIAIVISILGAVYAVLTKKPDPVVNPTDFDSWLRSQGIDPATVSPAIKATLLAEWQKTQTTPQTPPPQTPSTPGPMWTQIITLLLQVLPLFTKSAAGRTLTTAEHAKLASVSAEIDSLSEKVV